MPVHRLGVGQQSDYGVRDGVGCRARHPLGDDESLALVLQQLYDVAHLFYEFKAFWQKLKNFLKKRKNYRKGRNLKKKLKN